MVNKCILVGRLGKDPETRFTSSGQQVANFSIATDESWKDKNGEKQTKTEWHRIVAWSKLAEIIQKYVVKGQLVYIEGRLQTRKWSDKEGSERYSTEIVADTLRMLSRGKEKDEASARSNAPASAPEISDEDIPF